VVQALCILHVCVSFCACNAASRWQRCVTLAVRCRRVLYLASARAPAVATTVRIATCSCGVQPCKRCAYCNMPRCGQV
jgi:hypothetical protein